MANDDFISFTGAKNELIDNLNQILSLKNSDVSTGSISNQNLVNLKKFVNIDSIVIKYKSYDNDEIFEDNIYKNLIDQIINYIIKILNYHTSNVNNMVLTEIIFHTPINCGIIFTFPKETGIQCGTCNYNDDIVYGIWCSPEPYLNCSAAKIKYIKVNSLELTKKLLTTRAKKKNLQKF